MKNLTALATLSLFFVHLAHASGCDWNSQGEAYLPQITEVSREAVKGGAIMCAGAAEWPRPETCVPVLTMKVGEQTLAFAPDASPFGKSAGWTMPYEDYKRLNWNELQSTLVRENISVNFNDNCEETTPLRSGRYHVEIMLDAKTYHFYSPPVVAEPTKLPLF